MSRRPGADPDDVWARVAATVTPLAGRKPLAVRFEPVENRPPAPPSKRALDTLEPNGGKRPASRPSPPADTLDGGWDRRLRRGAVSPDRAIDLHGHTLVTAHAALEAALADAVGDGVRVLLVVTGKPPRAGEARRGLIRASIFDWLSHSRHAARIAAVRNAHPRHGGAGALYLILRRRRGE